MLSYDRGNFFLLIIFSWILAACQEEAGPARGNTTQSNLASGPVNITGSLVLSSEASAEAENPSQVSGDKSLQITDESGSKLAEAKTDALGNFQIQIDPGSLGLNESGGSKAILNVPRLLKLSSLFLINNTANQEKALGLSQSFLLDASRLPKGSDGIPTLDAGEQEAKKVGAITGTILLETGDDPTGIDVFIPGSSSIAKTDRNGQFILGFLPAGTYTLRAQTAGFMTQDWSDVAVGKNETTNLGSITLPIAIGPQVLQFETASIDDSTGRAELNIRLARATKYRMSRLSDFSDTVFKPVNFNKQEFKAEVTLGSGIKEAKIFLEAADSDGLSAQATLTIDREPPSQGTIILYQNKLLTNQVQVPLTLSAVGATKMRFAESVSALQQANWIVYSSNSLFPLASSSDGPRKIFVSYADAAGNILGAQGELFVSFTLDRTAPNDGDLRQLAPESPTGAFNTPLAWVSDLQEQGIQYQVEVSDQADFSNILRSMLTSQTIVNIQPPLSSPGLYHWRVRAIDAVGNSSAWAESSLANQKFFRVQVLASAYHSNKDSLGVPGQDRYFGKEMLRLSDLTADGVAEFAYSIPISSSSAQGQSCSSCGVVRLANGANQQTIYEWTDGQNSSTLFGHRIVACDVDNDGRDDWAVTAPGQALRQGGIDYNNAGAVYVYSGLNGNLLTTVTPSISTPLGNGWEASNCSLWNADYTQCLAYGWRSYPYSVEYLPWGDGRFFGWTASCRRKSGADHLLVGEPKFSSGGSALGRVLEYSLATGPNPQFTQVDAVVGAANQEMFGAGISHLSLFRYGSCTGSSEALAVGIPRAQVTGIEKGKVEIYQKNGSDQWVLCETIVPSASDQSYANYGQFLSNLGNIDQDGDGIEELAISSSTWNGGVVRVFGGASGTLLHSLRLSSSQSNRLGYKVLPAGDYNGDNRSELLISAPDAEVNGQWGAGLVYIYDLSAINAGDTVDDGSPLLTITGISSSGAGLGVSVLPIYSNPLNIHSASTTMLIASPSRNHGGEWSVGSFHQFKQLKLAPSLPESYFGESTNARLGTSIQVANDIDSDGVNDVLFGQPGGRCDGKPFGMISLFSVLDRKITKNICSDSNPNDGLGSSLQFFSSSNEIVFAKKSYAFYVTSSTNLLQSRDLSSSGISSQYSSLSTSPMQLADKKYFNYSNRIIIAAPNEWVSSNDKAGKILVSGPTLSPQCRITGLTANGQFGAWASFTEDINSDGIPEILVGEMGFTAGSSKGRVHILNGTILSDPGCGTVDVSFEASSSAYVLATIGADHSTIQSELGRPAEAGFGAFVLGLPDLDGDPAVHSGALYFLVANSNIKMGLGSSNTPQYFIFRMNADHSFQLLKRETGIAGAMLGGYAKVLADINGDSVPDLALSYPGGNGRFGNTGNVRIFSGLGITTSSSSDDLLQALFSPDPASSNFGISIEYGDMTADGLKDFIIGADQYDSALYPNAGAVYVYPMRPIQE